MKQILLNPGPANTSISVKQAQCVNDICPREQEFGRVMVNVKNQLTSFVVPNAYIHLYDTVLFGSSGTGAIESVISSLATGTSDRLLIIANGAYGKRAAEIANRYHIESTVVDFGESTLKYNDIERYISSAQYKYVYAIHCETTTGVINDIRKIGKLCKKYHTQFIVDAMSTYGAYEIDMHKDNINFLIASSNKGIQGMAGIGFVVFDKDAMELLKGSARSYYFDIYEQYKSFNKTNQLRFTPPVQTLYALQKALEELQSETVRGRYLRYKENNTVLNNGMKDLGFEQFTDPKDSSIIITSYYLKFGNHSFTFDDIHDFLYSKGFTIYPGKVTTENLFRVSNIGILTTKDIKKFIAAVKEFVKIIEHLRS